MIDLHNHILPGIDDGSRSMEETIEMAKIAVSEGISKIIATPHHKAPKHLTNKEEILENIKYTNEILTQANIQLEIFPGMEVYMSRDIPHKLHNKELLSLNNSSYLLIEFSMSEDLDYIEDVLHEVRIQGYKPIIAHPERYKRVIEDPNYVKKLIEDGCLFQINANSFTGFFGKEIKETVEILLAHKMIHLIGTDSHSSRKRSPKLKQAINYMRSISDDRHIGNILDNADRVFSNKNIEIEFPTRYENKKSFSSKAKGFFNFREKRI